MNRDYIWFCLVQTSSGVLFPLQLALILWCYLMVVFTDPGSVPENWRHDAEDGGDSALSTSEDQGTAPRYCSRCQNGKPPRCHHCSVCKSPFLMKIPYLSSYCRSITLWIDNSVTREHVGTCDICWCWLIFDFWFGSSCYRSYFLVLSQEHCQVCNSFTSYSGNEHEPLLV